ncbi:MAG: S9 family peptidase [bacterium]
MKRSLILILGLAIIAGGPGVFSVGCSKSDTDAAAKLIPREVLFGNPSKVSPRLSLDGKMWSFRAPVNGVMNVWVATVGEDDARPVTTDSMRGVQDYFWGTDSKHILYLEDDQGDENWRLCSVDIETLDFTCLTPFEGVQVNVIDRNKNFPDELLIAMNKDNPNVHDVYRLNVTSGDLTKVAENPGNVAGWVTDAEFKVRGAWVADATGGFELWVRNTEKSDWRTVGQWGGNDALTSGPITFTKDGGAIYLIDSRDANAGRLIKMNLADGEVEVVAEDPKYDIGSVEYNPDTYEIEWVTITRDRDEIVIMSDAVRADLEAIRQLNHGDMFLTSRDSADNTWMIGFIADDGPVSYYSWNRETRQATFLFDHRPELKEYTLASMEPFSFTARDGLVVHGYLSFPPGSDRKNLATVLNVHGGPWYRDTWGYNSEAQWLANRGYLCVQVNFRGSTGYGKDFLNASNREWGGKMHDDLVDAVEWVVGQGYADPEKVAIYGGSYGGYAALVGATFTPDLFCCAVDMVGVSNLLTFINSIPPYWSTFLEVLYQRVGNPATDEEFLKSRSPLFRADSIRIPMLIAQGANDPRVKQAESEQIVAAMKANDVDYEYLLFDDEGHGFVRPENRLKFYAAAEKFLAKHLGGRFEPAPAGQ